MVYVSKLSNVSSKICLPDTCVCYNGDLSFYGKVIMLLLCSYEYNTIQFHFYFYSLFKL